MIVTLLVLAYLAVGLLLSRHWTRQHLASTCPGHVDRVTSGPRCGLPRLEPELRTWLEYYQDPRVHKGQWDVILDGLMMAMLWPCALAWRAWTWAMRTMYMAPAEKAQRLVQEQERQRREAIDHWAKLSVSDDEWVRDQAVRVLEILGTDHAIHPRPLTFEGTPEDDREAALQLKSEIDAQRAAGPHFGPGGAW